MWSIPGLVSLSADQKRARRRMSDMRGGAMRNMRCYVTTRTLCRCGYLQILRRHETHYMSAMQGTSTTPTTAATETHAEEQPTSLHVQASAATHSELPTLGKICRRQTLSRLRRHVSSRFRLVPGTTEDKKDKGS